MVLATETDQYTTPRAPLRDIGPELSRKIVEIMEADRSGDAPERILSKWAGRNLFASRLTRWVRAGEAGFRPGVFGSIHRWAYLAAPTVLIHGHYMGSDKIDHFLRQGYDYFELAARGGSPVAQGVRQEHTYLGTLVSGVYSNADLAANYAGMKFYQNLRQPVRIGERKWPALFERSGNGWRLRAGVDADRVLEPFVSDHLDESLNPSRYRFGRAAIRSRIRERCGAWAEFYADRLELVARSGQSFAETWFGEEYGHWLPLGQEVSIATECFQRYDGAR